MLRILGASAVVLLCVSCAQSDDRVTELEARIAELEQASEAFDESGATTDNGSTSGRSLQDGGALEESSEQPDVGDPGSDEGQASETVPNSPSVGIVADAERALAEASNFGSIEGPGGVTATGTATEVTMQFVRDGLEDRPLLGQFLRSLGFAEDDVAQIEIDLGGAGTAETAAGDYWLTWNSGAQDLWILVRQQ